jgi:tetratricopeptide (TPR) repeat protein
LRAAFDHLHGAVLEMHGDHDAAVKILERARSEETDPLQRARMDIVLCSALLGIARFTDARDVCARGTADLERELTPDHPAVGFALMSVGNVALRLDDNETARVAFERSAKILESTVGHETVAYAFALMNLGLLAKRRGDVATARRNYERTIAILEPLHHAQLASALSNLAGIERSSGNYAAARAANVRAIAIATTSDGEQSARVAELTNDAGAIAFSAGEYDEAEASYKRALALATSLGADGTVSIADALGGLGLVAEERGDLRAAVSFYRRGIEADTQLYGAGDDTVARDLDNLGRCQLALGDGQAAATLTHALELYEARPMPNAFDVAHTQWDLARALSRHGTVPARALELARTARATFTRVTDAEAPVVLGQIDRWLAAHDKRRTGP